VNSMKKVYFVRHGEAEGNAKRISQDVYTPLTQMGHEQAKVVADRVAQLGITKIYTSHMTRAIETGEHVAKKLNLEPVPDKLFGEWMTPVSVRGKSFDSDEYLGWHNAVKENYTNSDWRYEDAENFSDLFSRISSAASLLEQDESDSILVVTHGKFLRLLLPFVLSNKRLTPEIHLDFEYAIALSGNAGISLFNVEGYVWKLVTWNDLAHFADN